MGRRKDKIDWANAQKLYRLGQLSLREIARQVGVEPSSITRRADRENWERDAAEDVRRATEQLLLSNENASAPTQEDIEAAAETNVTVVRGHRQFLSKMVTIAGRLADWMILEMDKKDPAMPKIAEAFVKTAQATARFIPLERQAFNIDKSGVGKQSYVEFLEALK